MSSVCFIFLAVPGHTIGLGCRPHQFCMVFVLSSHRVGVTELFFVVILVPMGNHSELRISPTSTHIKVHVRCGLMPSPCTRNVGTRISPYPVHGLMDGRSFAQVFFFNTNGNIAAFVVARMCVFSCKFPSSQRPSCTHTPAVQQRTCNRERSCACDVCAVWFAICAYGVCQGL